MRRGRQVLIAGEAERQPHLDVGNGGQAVHQFGEIARDAALGLDGEDLVVEANIHHELPAKRRAQGEGQAASPVVIEWWSSPSPTFLFRTCARLSCSVHVQSS